MNVMVSRVVDFYVVVIIIVKIRLMYSCYQLTYFDSTQTYKHTYNMCKILIFDFHSVLLS